CRPCCSVYYSVIERTHTHSSSFLFQSSRDARELHSFPTRRSSDLKGANFRHVPSRDELGGSERRRAPVAGHRRPSALRSPEFIPRGYVPEIRPFQIGRASCRERV